MYSHAIPSLKEQRRLTAGKNDDEIMPGVQTEEDDRDFEGLLTAEEMDRTRVRKRIRAMQDACHAKQIVVPVLLLNVIDLRFCL